MRIKRFKAKNVHGYMNFNVKFNDDLTFLTGINGSGKTTVIQCLYAIISPSFRMLANMKYEYMRVIIQVPEQRRFVTISTTRNETTISLFTSETDQFTSETDRILTIPVLPEDVIENPRYTPEREIEYYEEMLNRNIDNVVLKYIRNLPSPMFLGIERRTIEPLGRRVPSYYLRRRLGINVISNLQYRSLSEAEYLAREQYSAVQEKQRDLTDKLRTDILLTALKYGGFEDFDWKQFGEYPPARIDEINQMIRNVASDLNLPTTEVDHELNLFSTKLRSLSKTLGDTLKSPEKIMETIKQQDIAKITAWSELAINFPHLLRIDKMFEHVKSYVKQRQLINDPINQYLKIVNDFLKDSNKELAFDGKGNLLVNLSGHEPVPITSLSSGESQIVVMITHLSFNPEAQRANVFMVDEPELSLHLAWQELFVDSITKANPNLQIILATHAPSIILDRDDKCVDLGK